VPRDRRRVARKVAKTQRREESHAEGAEESEGAEKRPFPATVHTVHWVHWPPPEAQRGLLGVWQPVGVRRHDANGMRISLRVCHGRLVRPCPGRPPLGGWPYPHAIRGSTPLWNRRGASKTARPHAEHGDERRRPAPRDGRRFPLGERAVAFGTGGSLSECGASAPLWKAAMNRRTPEADASLAAHSPSFRVFRWHSCLLCVLCVSA
jgi:hypothetical protein